MSSNRDTKQTTCTTCHGDCASSERCHRTGIPYKQHAQHVTGIVHQVKDVIKQGYQTNNMHNMSRGLSRGMCQTHNI
ncbi:unnamed protein product [Sphacelaria rigidula]